MHVRRSCALSILVLLLSVSPLAAQCVSLTALGSAYTQDFNSLASSGTSSVVPTGWAFSESGTNKNTTYTAGTGSSNAGDTYSFGNSSDRAFGGLQSGSLVPTIGACFTNNTGAMITSLAVAYTGEEWRFGATGRADRLDFQYSAGATSLTTGTWTDVDTLDFSTPNTSAAVGALDGNLAANRTSISSAITGLVIPNGSTFWIRWNDLNATSSDDGLAVDDFSLTPDGVIPVNPIATATATPGTVAAGSSTLLTVTVTPGTPPSLPITVTGDLSAIGGVSAQTLFDDGTHGDVTAGDNIFSVAATVDATTPPGSKTLTFTAKDNLSRTATAAAVLGVSSGPSNIVISQIYGGGGNSGAPLKNDFIELFNRGTAAVDLTGWSVQYASATGSSWQATPLSGMLQPGHYYLVQEAAGSGDAAALPAPDATGSISMAAASAKVALSNGTASLSGNCPLAAIDLVGYGTATCSETHAIGILGNGTAGLRRLGGCTETNDNSLDFYVAAPAPRNSSSPANDCSSIVVTPPTPHVVISQIYTAGGDDTTSTYSNDFVEIHNPTGSSVDLTDWSIQYAADTGEGWGATMVPIGGTIGPNEYYLIRLGSGGKTGTNVFPSARITGTLNLSRGGGKIALVHGLDGLTGRCPIGNASIADLVGYGTADCYEGGLPATAPSAFTEAMQRRDNGNTDTDFNSADFLTGAPDASRGSGPAIDLPPRITSKDPAGATAPFDASITINFSESVTVSGGWFSISCTSSGAHDSVQQAPAFTRTAYILIPNVSFTPGETCTVHLFKDLIVDEDGDPTHPTSDVVWTFTIATGTPVEFADVHLTMGNPTGATLADPNNYLMKKPEFAMSYNGQRGTANWVSWHLTSAWVGSSDRTDTYRPDPAIPPNGSYRVLHTDYAGSGFDRGHMCPSADRTADIPINQATFLMTNMVPQAPDNNQGPWENLESYLRTLYPANDLFIVSGPAGTGGVGSKGPDTVNTIAGGNVTVPAWTWKAALVVPKGTTSPSSVTAAARTIAVIMPNVQGINTGNPDNWTTYLKTVRDVEALCVCDLFSNVPAIVQNSIENGTNGINPPGVADQAATVEAGVPATITLAAVSPKSSPTFTWRIVTPPSHGTLTGAASDAAHTYTSTVDYTGADSFIFLVNDGSFDSKTATVRLNVVDTTPPSLSVLKPSVTKLWPPNHQMADVTVDYTATDAGDSAPVCSLNVTSNEPVEGTGDGDMSPDWVVVDAHHVRLRAERAGSGSSRIYTIGADCSDRSGNTSHASTAVTVPKDQH